MDKSIVSPFLTHGVYMLYNNCLTRKFSYELINYRHVTRYAYACSHILFTLYVRAAETAPEAVRLVRQTQLKHVCV